jgi:hypothetical protein
MSALSGMFKCLLADVKPQALAIFLASSMCGYAQKIVCYGRHQAPETCLKIMT